MTATTVANPGIKSFVQGELSLINAELAKDTKYEGHLIHEIAILRIVDNNHDQTGIVFAECDDDSEVQMQNLWNVLSAFCDSKGQSTEHKLFALPEQAAKAFDFCLERKPGGAEYFAFGNNLKGSFKELQENEAWSIVEPMIVRMLDDLIMMIHGQYLSERE
jgi:hypothetical protein